MLPRYLELPLLRVVSIVDSIVISSVPISLENTKQPEQDLVGREFSIYFCSGHILQGCYFQKYSGILQTRSEKHSSNHNEHILPCHSNALNDIQYVHLQEPAD